MKELIKLLKKEDETAEKCHICFKEFSDPEEVYGMALHGFILGSNPQQLQPELSNTRPHFHCFSQPSRYDTHLYIKEIRKKFKKNDIGVFAENKQKQISLKVKINIKLVGVTNEY